jgi:hypothetical protein
VKSVAGLFQNDVEAPPVGLEPTTDWLTASRSTTLSYGGTLGHGYTCLSFNGIFKFIPP